MSYDFIGCAKRLGTVLIGRTEPSVTAVENAAKGIFSFVSTGLKALYDDTVGEPVPSRFTDLLASLPEDGAPQNGGGRAPH